MGDLCKWKSHFPTTYDFTYNCDISYIFQVPVVGHGEGNKQIFGIVIGAGRVQVSENYLQ